MEQPLIQRTRSDQNLNPIEEYDRDRIEREMMMPDIRYIHQEKEILDRSLKSY